MSSGVSAPFSKPMTSGESGNSCLTSSPSPRVRNSESNGESDAPATSNGGSSWEGRPGGRMGGEDDKTATPQPYGGDDSGLPKTSIWTEFDSPPHAASNKRALQRRKCDFKIIVVFRGGWCTSSHNLLKGESVPGREIERGHCAAGSPSLAQSSQFAEFVFFVCLPGLVRKEVRYALLSASSSLLEVTDNSVGSQALAGQPAPSEHALFGGSNIPRRCSALPQELAPGTRDAPSSGLELRKLNIPLLETCRLSLSLLLSLVVLKRPWARSMTRLFFTYHHKYRHTLV